ncbi:MAG: G/U mismatch-specific DNA glycosylase [Candidatus Polarisedimenticolia bacterium]
MSVVFRPTPEQIRAAAGKTLGDVIAPALRVLFVGINPGLYTAAVGHHFARPGNRFWPALHLSGFTPRLLSPFEEDELPALGYGITNIVRRATASAAELKREELKAGGRRLASKVRRYRPRLVAVLGIGAYRTAFDRPEAALGLQTEKLEGARLWVLPNPSGLNAHHQMEDLARRFRELKRAATSHVLARQ